MNINQGQGCNGKRAERTLCKRLLHTIARPIEMNKYDRAESLSCQGFNPGHTVDQNPGDHICKSQTEIQVKLQSGISSECEDSYLPYYRAILETSEEGIFGIDISGRCNFVNDAAITMLGYKEKELLGRFEHALFHHTRQDGSLYPSKECPINLTLHNGQACKNVEEIFWRKDGTHFPVKYNCNPVRDKDDKVIGAVVVFLDTTVNHQLATELLMAQKLEAVGQLAAGIAHEINTPMQYVGDNIRFIYDAHISLQKCTDTLIELLDEVRKQGLFPELVEKYDLVSHEADREYIIEEYPLAINHSLEGIDIISKIVKAMKEFSHPGQDGMESTSINHIIKNTITVSKNEWKYNCDISTELDEELPDIKCDAQSIGQALLNIIINASHAIADGENKNGEIKIKTGRVNEFVEIIISDNGKGIPKKIQTKIFDPFFTTKKVGKGTGQGLAMAHATIVEKHNGKITCESEPGKGTVFTISLPVNLNEEAAI